MLSILGKIFLYSRDENILAINKTKHDHKSRSEFVLNTNCQLSKLYWRGMALSASCMGMNLLMVLKMSSINFHYPTISVHLHLTILG